MNILVLNPGSATLKFGLYQTRDLSKATTTDSATVLASGNVERIGEDGVAFAGGIGEHSASMRNRICQGLGFLGLQLDDELNGAADGRAAMRISEDSGSVQIWVIPTDEERQIAWATYEQLRNCVCRT